MDNTGVIPVYSQSTMVIYIFCSSWLMVAKRGGRQCYLSERCRYSRLFSGRVIVLWYSYCDKAVVFRYTIKQNGFHHLA